MNKVANTIETQKGVCDRLVADWTEQQSGNKRLWSVCHISLTLRISSVANIRTEADASQFVVAPDTDLTYSIKSISNSTNNTRYRARRGLSETFAIRLLSQYQNSVHVHLALIMQAVCIVFVNGFYVRATKVIIVLSNRCRIEPCEAVRKLFFDSRSLGAWTAQVFNLPAREVPEDVAIFNAAFSGILKLAKTSKTEDHFVVRPMKCDQWSRRP